MQRWAADRPMASMESIRPVIDLLGRERPGVAMDFLLMRCELGLQTR
jgi:hypothetical protein